MAKKKTNKSSQPQDLNIYPPVVVVLGHVDHGKTTLLDTIRKTNIAGGESGGITQKIGASKVEIMHEGKSRTITFIDTPGHEAFSLMRGRGVQAADIALLIVSSVDGVMPQTKESIALLNTSKIPFIAVLTKSDDQNKNPEKTKQQLLKEEVMLEGFGGDVPIIEVSAKTNTNVKELLDLILLVYDMKREAGEYLFSEKNPFEAIIIESKLDKRAGAKATLVVKNGSFALRDELMAENIKGKIRTIINDSGEFLQKVTVGDAVEVLGFEDVPKIGSVVKKVQDLKAEELITKEDTRPLKREEVLSFEQDLKGDMLSFIICADTQGSLEAVTNALPENIRIAYKKTGDIEASDVLFAKSIGAFVLGFNIKIKPEVSKLATTEKVLLKNYTLIYEMLDEVKDFVEGNRLSLLEKVYGQAKILASFPFEKTKVLGVAVTEGRLAKGDRVRLMRGEEIIGETSITSLRQGKESISKVEKGQEAGVIISPFLDFTIGDMLISHA